MLKTFFIGLFIIEVLFVFFLGKMTQFCYFIGFEKINLNKKKFILICFNFKSLLLLLNK